jgi:hypothetical protein
VDLEFLVKPVEEPDALLTGLMDGTAVAIALVVAFVLVRPPPTPTLWSRSPRSLPPTTAGRAPRRG